MCVSVYVSLFSVKGKTTCSFCKLPIDGHVKISINIPAICCHPDCFKVYCLNLFFLSTQAQKSVSHPSTKLFSSESCLIFPFGFKVFGDLITGGQCSIQVLTRSKTFCDGIIETYRSPRHLLLLFFSFFLETGSVVT